MANCPNCGSNHIQIKQETDVNWGRAITGYALFGIVGGAVGAVTGEDRNVNACLDCGTSWKAEQLYKILQIIKECTGEKLNLAREHDPLYMNNFIYQVGSYLQQIPEIERKADQLIADAKLRKAKEPKNPVLSGCILSILFSFFALCSGSPMAIFIGLIFASIPTLLGLAIVKLDKMLKEANYV